MTRVIFMGTPEFSVPCLHYLVERGIAVLGVITRPDKPKGRGQREQFSPVKQKALELGLPIWQPERVDDPEFLELLSREKPDTIVVAAFGQILKKVLLELPSWGCINLHASLLPKYRGAAPIQWAIARGETQTGVTVQHMAEAVDSGDIVTQQPLSIGPDETADELCFRLAELGGPAVEAALSLLAQHGGAVGQPQDASQATWAPRLKRDDGRIDWSLRAEDIHNRVRAFNPWPGTFTLVKGECLKIIATQRSQEPAPVDSHPGDILQVDTELGWWVAAGGGTTLRVVHVQCPNSKIMAAQAYTCGYRTGIHDVLG